MKQANVQNTSKQASPGNVADPSRAARRAPTIAKVEPGGVRHVFTMEAKRTERRSDMRVRNPKVTSWSL